METIFYDYIDKHETTVLHLVGDYINIYILFRCIVKRSGYYQEYFDYIKPEVFLTFYDNSFEFLLIDTPKDCVKISVQNGSRSKLNDIYAEFNKNHSGLLSNDYAFVFSDAVARLYKEYIQCKTYSIGSFRSNKIKVLSHKKKYSNLYISHFRPNYLQSKKILFKDVTWGDYIKNEVIFIKWLASYTYMAGIKLNILGSSKYGSNIEHEYYKKLLVDSDFNFIPNYLNRDTYNIIDTVETIISVDSTLGYEALSRGAKVAMFSGIRGDRHPLDSRRFGWPEELHNTGKFWTNVLNEDEWKKVIEYVDTASNKEWSSNLKVINKIMQRDDQNSQFHNLINELLSNGV